MSTKKSTKKSSQKKVAKATAVEPVIEQPVSEELISEQSVYEELISEQSICEEPVSEQPVVEPSAVEQSSQESPQFQSSPVVELRIDEIVPNPMNPRRYFDHESLSELAQNIIEHGVLQPVTVREISRDDGKKYEIVFGERRFRAVTIAGFQTLPCMIRRLCDEEAFDLMISENLQRQDIRPSEEGEAFKKMIDRGKTIAYISERFGKSESFIHGRLSLVRLIPEITAMLDSEEISIGMAVEIARMEPDIQQDIFHNHLCTDISFNSWKNLPLKIFREKMEATYTVLLSRFSFDKTECEQCPFNSELHSLFPVPENSRCTWHVCLVKKQEKYLLEGILAAVRKENAEVYIDDKSRGAFHTELITRLDELGIVVKSAMVYPMPENPVMPAQEDFADDQSGYEQAQKDFHLKQTKWNTLQTLLQNGLARKVVTIENMEPALGYIMVVQERKNTAETTEDCEDGHNPDSPQNSRPASSATGTNGNTAIKPDLMSTLEQKDVKNREEALCRVIDDAKNLMKETDIPPVAITPFEEALMNYTMLSCLDHRHYEFFGIPEGESLTEDRRFMLYASLTAEQKNVLMRDFLIHNMTQGTGISKRAALLVELAKYHFPDDMAIIESTRNEEYLKKREIILEQMDKIRSEKGNIK